MLNFSGILLCMLFSHNVYALPESFEVWFLSVDRNQGLQSLLYDKEEKSSLLSLQNLQCQPMGEYCFDPQVGLYKNGDENQVESVDYSEVDESNSITTIESATSLDRNMIECDKDHLFDIFCGKAQVENAHKPAKLEIWFDISSTMKQIDFLGYEKNTCMRQSLVERLQSSKCELGNNLGVSVFNESKKQIDTVSRVCQNYGLNNMKRLVQEIQQSDAKHLIIITDIFEAEESFISFFEGNPRGTVRGVEEPLYAKDMKKMLPQLEKKCH